ncbi:MAG: hypothetical protein K6A74_01410, partial [Lachnospiraceae bacterium]|nr:hypothetical protein [Lachnospiraceae bacterium]
MRIKRSLAFLLALVLLFSETATAFAADVSDNEPAPFVLSEDTAEVISDEYPADEEAEYNVDDVSNGDVSSGDVSEGEIDIRFKEGSYESEYYYELDTDYYSGNFYIWSDAVVIVNGVEHYFFEDEEEHMYHCLNGRSFHKVVDTDYNPVNLKWGEDLSVGQYFMPVSYEFEGEEYTIYLPFEVKSAEDMPVGDINTDYSGDRIRLKLAGREGYTYSLERFTGSESWSAYYWDGKQYVFGLDDKDEIVCHEDRTYYLELVDIEKTCRIIERPAIVALETIDQPYNTEYYEYLYEASDWADNFAGLVLKATYSDGTTKTFKTDEIFGYYGANVDIIDKETSAVQENPAAGNYYARISWELAQIKIPITLISINGIPKISFDSENPTHLTAK